MKFDSSIVFLALFPSAAIAFQPVSTRNSLLPHVSTTRFSPLRMSDEPSDTSSDSLVDVLEVDSEPFIPTESEATITSLLDLVPSSLAEITESKRSIVNEVILKLEALNPTPDPAFSPLINGVWELRYAAGYSSDWALPSPTRQAALFLYSGGYSPGLFALRLAKQVLPSGLVDVDGLEISISREQPRVQATVQIKALGSTQQIQVKALLQAESGIRLRETYESTSIMSGNSMEIPEPLRYSREFCKFGMCLCFWEDSFDPWQFLTGVFFFNETLIDVTFVDEDILIIRDASGVPELLVRKEKNFSKQWGTEPSEVEDS